MERLEVLAQVERFKELLVLRSKNGYPDHTEYVNLRKALVTNHAIAHLLPQMVRQSRTPAEFWSYIKPKFGHWNEREEHIRQEFDGLMTALETGVLEPALHPAEEVLKTLDSDEVEQLIAKALRRTPHDPNGAVTVAKSLLESTCKLILDDVQQPYEPNAPIPLLFKLVSQELKLHPDDQPNDSVKKVLRGCSSIVQGIAEIRNSVGDGHGHGNKHKNAAPRHARLVVGAAGIMSAFLVETYEFRKTREAKEASQHG